MNVCACICLCFICALFLVAAGVPVPAPRSSSEKTEVCQHNLDKAHHTGQLTFHDYPKGHMMTTQKFS